MDQSTLSELLEKLALLGAIQFDLNLDEENSGHTVVLEKNCGTWCVSIHLRRSQVGPTYNREKISEAVAGLFPMLENCKIEVGAFFPRV